MPEGGEHGELFSEAPTQPGLGAMPDPNDLQEAWHVEGRHYGMRGPGIQQTDDEIEIGKIEVNGVQYQFRVSFVSLDNVDSKIFPTNKRVVTEVGVDL
ncbi:hypothetical protein HZA40_05345 [Candidatus Peregrinibacteria bacterium]|nr:hypothetical protein [Candidatus Peregrinibacteria bacterium]